MHPIALRSLLLADDVQVSTQQAVTPGAKAVAASARLARALWIWVAGVTVAAFGAALAGADAASVAGGLALAVSPALASFILLPDAGSRWGAAGMLAAWLAAATGLAAGGGGWASPMVLVLAVVPGLAMSLRPSWGLGAGGTALVGYALAGFIGVGQEAALLGVFPTVVGGVALVFAAFVIVADDRVGGGHERAIGQRVAEVSHELRTPLTHILGFSEMIERQLFGALNERYVEYAGLIRRSGAHLLELVNDLLDLSRIESGKYDLELQSFDARDVVADVVRMNIDLAAKKSIHVGMITPETPLMVHADDRAVRRILINIVGNAVKFTPEGGRVMVSVVAHDGQLRIDTIDTGLGIPESERAKLGNAYERGAAGASAEGTGLGLSLVRALAQLHGGVLSFHDAPGGGALVRVDLPVLTRL